MAVTYPGAATFPGASTYPGSTPGDDGTAPILVNVDDFRRLVRGRADDDTRTDLLLFLHATDEVVAEIVGPLTGPIPNRWRLAGRIIAEHLWDHWEGAVPTDYQGGTDTEALFSGFAVPRAAQELLVSPNPAAARVPTFSFPEPACWPGL